MLFIVDFATSPSTRDAGIDRFKETGAPPPAGVKMVGRWHRADGTDGVYRGNGRRRSPLFARAAAIYSPIPKLIN